ncbi:unnamed protein product [Amoebophrya sp. A120]|nr:unnamed protein product [Amoebophrya sp. A120]|eukprot:GSA120T00020361001.1
MFATSNRESRRCLRTLWLFLFTTREQIVSQITSMAMNALFAFYFFYSRPVCAFAFLTHEIIVMPHQIQTVHFLCHHTNSSLRGTARSARRFIARPLLWFS